MAGTKLSFSKVVATPTANAWSQAYSAGSLFAAISLENPNQNPGDNNLNSLGKDVISTLESEFFTVENKDLESIKVAINATISKINENINLSFVICYLNENILYLYAAGDGKAILKRGEKIGTVIDSEPGREIKSASGYVQDKDYIVLETKQFQNVIAQSTLAAALDKKKVDDISEDLAPHIHEKEEGGASAVVLTYNENATGIEQSTSPEAATIGAAAAMSAGQSIDNDEIEENESLSEEEKEEEATAKEGENDEIEQMEQALNDEEKKEVEKPLEAPSEGQKTPEEISQINYADSQKSRRRVPKIGFGRLKKIPRRILIVIGVIIILIILIAGIFMFINRGGSGNGDFDAIYNQALEKYEEGQSLKDLNESLAQENFKEAQQILVENQNTFPEGSDEDNQIEDLLNRVNQELGGGETNAGSTTATEVDTSESQILSIAIENNSKYLTQNDDFIFFITEDGIVRIDKGNDEEETVVETDWTEEGGIGVFGSNIYVLDKEDNILKFVPGDDGYSKTDYITGTVPDLTGSTSMAIDGSIYVLDTDGSVTKFTRGAEDSFTVSGLSTPLSSPTQIWANEDSDNIYILDNGNSRIVVLGNNGEFSISYTADIIKNATAFDVQEDAGEIFVLSGDKIYKIELQ